MIRTNEQVKYIKYNMWLYVKYLLHLILSSGRTGSNLGKTGTEESNNRVNSQDVTF